jgi:hypothetical protein
VVIKSDADVYLYSISEMGIKVSEVNSMDTTLASVIFPPQPYPWWYFYGYAVDDTVAVPVPAIGQATGGAVMF